MEREERDENRDEIILLVFKSNKTEWPKGNMSKGFQHAQLNCELLPVYQAVQFTQPSRDIGYGSVQMSWEHKFS